MTKIVTLRSLLLRELRMNGERLDDVEAITLSDEELDQAFDNDYGDEAPGDGLVAWTPKYVYYQEESDMMTFIESVPRNPTKKSRKL